MNGNTPRPSRASRSGDRQDTLVELRMGEIPLAMVRPPVIAVAQRSDPAVAERHATIRRDAPAIYGGLLVTALIAVQWRSDAIPELVALSILVTVFVFWLTHVWAEVVDHRVNGPVSRRVIGRLAASEAPMLTAAIPPTATLALARLVGAPVDQAISLALVVSIAQLLLWGLSIGRALDRGWGIALIAAAIEGAFGLLLVALKVVVVH